MEISRFEYLSYWFVGHVAIWILAGALGWLLLAALRFLLEHLQHRHHPHLELRDYKAKTFTKEREIR